MNKYEITYLAAEDLKEKPVDKEIEKLGGKVLGANSVGSRQLTYKIKGQTTGFFSSVQFEMEPDKVFDFNKVLALNNDILRFLIITSKAASIVAKPESKKEAKEVLPMKPETEIAPPKPEAIAPVEKQEVMISPEKEEVKEPVAKEKPKTKLTAKKPTKTAPVKPAPVKEEKSSFAKATQDKPESKVVSEAEKDMGDEEERLKALDKKLDELLKE